ncbi:hypothetical protein OG866_25650 [Streptomyces sp. NBC_00663]|uniref:hypothetical protein n=1 Tax=Streptomyces sp. NBC_00663 TaxID=2975801 RepID=UPI002E36A833|nr:hypothetical protein [Streptomyces sp. NBC_00663]
MTDVDVADLWFELPPGFVEFDLAEDPEARMLRMADAVDALFADATPEQKFSLVVSGEHVLTTMISAGAAHVSSCLLRMPGDEPSQAMLCVLVEHPQTGPEFQDRQAAARRTAAQWRALHPDAEVGLVMLPYGISALCIREQHLAVPGALFGLPDPVPATVRQAEFWVPLKTGPGAVLFVFTTQDVAHWARYVDVLSGIVKSISEERA